MIRRSENPARKSSVQFSAFRRQNAVVHVSTIMHILQDIGVLIFGVWTFGALHPAANFSKNWRGTYFRRGTYLRGFTVLVKIRCRLYKQDGETTEDADMGIRRNAARDFVESTMAQEFWSAAYAIWWRAIWTGLFYDKEPQAPQLSFISQRSAKVNLSLTKSKLGIRNHEKLRQSEYNET